MTDHTALQEQVGRLWAQALGVDTVAADDNFFARGAIRCWR